MRSAHMRCVLVALSPFCTSSNHTPCASWIHRDILELPRHSIFYGDIKKMSKYCQALSQALSSYDYGDDLVNKVHKMADSCKVNDKRPVYNVPCPLVTYRKYRSDMKNGSRSVPNYRLQHICRSAEYRKAINARTRTRRRLLKSGLILPTEHLHHLNEDPLDSRPENLVALTKAQHERLHKSAATGKERRPYPQKRIHILATQTNGLEKIDDVSNQEQRTTSPCRVQHCNLGVPAIKHKHVAEVVHAKYCQPQDGCIVWFKSKSG